MKTRDHGSSSDEVEQDRKRKREDEEDNGEADPPKSTIVCIDESASLWPAHKPIYLNTPAPLPLPFSVHHKYGAGYLSLLAGQPSKMDVEKEPTSSTTSEREHLLLRLPRRQPKCAVTFIIELIFLHDTELDENEERFKAKSFHDKVVERMYDFFNIPKTHTIRLDMYTNHYTYSNGNSIYIFTCHGKFVISAEHLKLFRQSLLDIPGREW
jgi:hypothetical protein